MSQPRLIKYSGTWSIRGARLELELRATAYGVDLVVNSLHDGSRNDDRWSRSFPNAEGISSAATQPEEIQLIEGGEHGRLAFMPKNRWASALREGCYVDLEEGMWVLLATAIPAALNLAEQLRELSGAIAPRQWLEDRVRSALLGVLVEDLEPQQAVDLAFIDAGAAQRAESIGSELDQEWQAVRVRTLARLQCFTADANGRRECAPSGAA